MPACIFKTDEIRRCAEHALRASAHEMPFMEDETPTPALLFVHDSGVYVMSNGIPRDLLSIEPGRERSYIAYADGTNPAENEDWWHTSADLVGGDDFVEIIPVTQQFLDDCNNYNTFFVDCDNEAMTLQAGFSNPRRTATATSV